MFRRQRCGAAAARPAAQLAKDVATLNRSQAHACAGNEPPRCPCRRDEEVQTAHTGPVVGSTVAGCVRSVVQVCNRQEDPGAAQLARVCDRASVQVTVDTQAEHHAVLVRVHPCDQTKHAMWYLACLQGSTEQGKDGDAEAQ